MASNVGSLGRFPLRLPLRGASMVVVPPIPPPPPFAPVPGRGTSGPHPTRPRAPCKCIEWRYMWESGCRLGDHPSAQRRPGVSLGGIAPLGSLAQMAWHGTAGSTAAAWTSRPWRLNPQGASRDPLPALRGARRATGLAGLLISGRPCWPPATPLPGGTTGGGRPATLGRFLPSLGHPGASWGILGHPGGCRGGVCLAYQNPRKCPLQLPKTARFWGVFLGVSTG